ncbi:maleate cis-trans isomerase [Streptomyces longwoodensis]|uniref:Maleate cis-trans isomerase n=1 Tax=Streptomyces lasalocidi TaxID=324833 RepID=A0A4U5WPI7_STRLS|nr:MULTISPECIES: maleate cis-trans isomerase [Streptomyces]MCX4997222.1 maleate cis-trans isomerase [Streptomyces longwoodensis]TKT04089.1 maleate cis-trans isomerase [Streptomyces lasalocidi]WRY91865.1 maleate cis-trans isomerase [Streptomyces longwoodensis]WTI43846.1 maleate cis-trans isomerase [Streptomyces longwoodensis]WUC56620.1 maleate cis-trans isomerase [Streptomyces longwoodensis]
MPNVQAERDGWEAEARVGVVVPHADVGPESEFQAIAPDDVFIHASRVHFAAMRPGGEMDPKIPHDPVRAFVEPPLIDDAVELLAASPLDVIALGFTSSAYVLGASGEKELFDRLAQRTRGIPLTATTAAAVTGFTALGARKVAIVNPPWFDDRLSGLGADYFTEQGFTVVHHGPCGLPSNQKLITPEALSDWIRTTVADHRPDAVLVAGNGIRAVGVIQALEKELDFAVLTANQALFWHALHLAGAGGAAARITGYGRLFETAPRDGTS